MDKYVRIGYSIGVQIGAAWRAAQRANRLGHAHPLIAELARYLASIIIVKEAVL